MLNIDISNMVEIIAHNKCESHPPVLFFGVHSKKYHEKYELAKKCKLKHGIISQKSHITKVLKISI